MAFGRLAALAAGPMHGKMTRIERSCELAQRLPLSGPVRPFEKDDRTSAVHDLRQLQLREMIAKRHKRGVIIRAARGGPSIHHTRFSGRAEERQ